MSLKDSSEGEEKKKKEEMKMKRKKRRQQLMRMEEDGEMYRPFCYEAKEDKMIAALEETPLEAERRQRGIQYRGERSTHEKKKYRDKWT